MPNMGSVLAEMDQFLEQLRVKSAADDEGAQDTTHPSAGVDNSTQPASEGARSAENEGDVADKVVGPDINTASAADANKPAEPVKQTSAKATGEDPANETASASGELKDPGTTHPANSDDVGAKYASQEELEAAIRENPVKVAADLSNKLLADISVLLDEHIKAAEELAGSEEGGKKEDKGEGEEGDEGEDEEDEEAEKAAQAGALAAQQFEEQLLNELSQVEKVAGQAQDVVRQIQKEAAADAEMLIGYYQGLAKAAEDEEGTGEDEGAGSLPPEDIAALAAAANEPAGGAVPPAAGPAIPPEALAGAGADELANADEEQVVEALSDALEEAGVTPEELAQAVAAEQAGGEASPEEKAAAVAGARASAEAIMEHRRKKQAGKVEKRASIALKYQMRQMVRDLLGR